MARLKFSLPHIRDEAPSQKMRVIESLTAQKARKTSHKEAEKRLKKEGPSQQPPRRTCKKCGKAIVSIDADAQLGLLVLLYQNRMIESDEVLILQLVEPVQSLRRPTCRGEP